MATAKALSMGLGTVDDVFAHFGAEHSNEQELVACLSALRVALYNLRKGEFNLWPRNAMLCAAINEQIATTGRLLHIDDKGDVRMVFFTSDESKIVRELLGS